MMRPIGVEEVKDLSTYERLRPEMRKRVVELRNLRRIRAGERISIVFENRETVLYQIQEMLRAGRIVEEAALRHEIETFNELLPKPHHLAGTLFVEHTDPARIREDLEDLSGLDRGDHLWFDLGPAGRVRARFMEGPRDEGRTASVHHLLFPFAREAESLFRTLSHPVHLVVEHPNYRTRVPVEGPARRSLAEDLAEE